MATLNYVTLKVPEILFRHVELIQRTPQFNVCRYTRQKGIIFRIPHKLKAGNIVHCFIEHEVNFSNTLKTGTLTLKVQLTLVPAHMGIFSGFKNLNGTHYFDESDDDGYDLESFKPDYNHIDNEIYVAPLPIGIRSNLYEYLNEILFQHCDDANLLHRYAVDLGCQKDTIRKSTLVPTPELNSDLPKAKKKHLAWMDFFESAKDQNISLIPKNQLKLGI